MINISGSKFKANEAAVKRVSYNIFSASFANIGERGLFFIFIALLARELGPKSCGAFITSFVVVNIVFIFNELGLVSIVSREAAKNRGDAGKYFNNMLGIRSITLPFSLVIILAVLLTSNYCQEVKKGIMIFSAYFVLCYLSHSFIAIFRAFERMDLVALMIIGDRGIVTTFGCILMFAGAELAQIEYLFLIGGASRLIVGSLFVRQCIGSWHFCYDFLFWRHLLKKSIPLGFYMMLSLVYFRVDTLLLSVFGNGSVEVGWYNAAYNIFAVLSLPSMSFSMAIFPVLTRLFAENNENFAKYCFAFLTCIVSVSLIISISAYILAKPIINILYGNEYSDSINILKILTIASFWSSLGCLTHSLLIAVNRGKELLYVVIAATCANIVLNIVLIPSMASIGAALTTTFSEICAVSCTLYLLYVFIVKRAPAAQVCNES